MNMKPRAPIVCEVCGMKFTGREGQKRIGQHRRMHDLEAENKELRARLMVLE